MSVALESDNEAAALACLNEGCRAEKARDWAAALVCYQRLLYLQPQAPPLRYFGHNNLAYVLIQLGRFDEAEHYCLAAIDIEDARHNAHKNLGLALLGQGRWLDGAMSLLDATELAPMDPRAWQHLKQLLAARPGLLLESEVLNRRWQAVGKRVANEGLRVH